MTTRRLDTETDDIAALEVVTVEEGANVVTTRVVAELIA